MIFKIILQDVLRDKLFRYGPQQWLSIFFWKKTATLW